MCLSWGPQTLGTAWWRGWFLTLRCSQKLCCLLPKCRVREETQENVSDGGKSTQPPREEPTLSILMRLSRALDPIIILLGATLLWIPCEIFPSSLILAGIHRHSQRIFTSIKFIINFLRGVRECTQAVLFSPPFLCLCLDDRLCCGAVCSPKQQWCYLATMCEVPAWTCRWVTNMGLSLLLPLPAHISAEICIIIQMSRALNGNRDENKAKKMKKHYYKPGSSTMNLFKVIMA